MLFRSSVPEDYDIATDARPEDITNIFKRTVPVGIHYGVVLVIENGFEFEVATFRSDGTYTDGRHPDTVTFCDARGDALRRDFTINGMFYDPVDDKHFDYVGGREDLKARLVRAIGAPSERFNEDRLRMIRAVRFACRFDYKIEDQTADAIKRLYDKILTVSMERTRDELRKILTGPSPHTGIKMREHGIIFKITKNRITKLALEKTRCKELSNLFTGPTAVALSQDAITSAKILTNFSKENSNLKILGGIMGNDILDVVGVKNVASLPSL